MTKPTMPRIELAAQEHRRDLDNLRNLLAQLNDAIESAKREYLPSIRRGVATTRGSRLRLAEMIADAPELFVKPKSRESHGLRIGYRKDKDAWIWPTMEELVRRVRNRLDASIAEAMIQTTESIQKGGLTPEIRDLLGIPFRSGVDRVTIEQLDGEVDNLIAAMLGDLSAELDADIETEAA